MITAFFIGIILGLVYFGGLYYSSQAITNVKRPGLIMSFSLFLRMGILIFGLYFLAKRGLQDILIGFIAIMLVRIIMVMMAKNKKIGE